VPNAICGTRLRRWSMEKNTFLGSDTIDLVDVVPQTRASRNRRVHRHGARRCIYIPPGPYVLGMCGIESSYFANTGFPRWLIRPNRIFFFWQTFNLALLHPATICMGGKHFFLRGNEFFSEWQKRPVHSENKSLRNKFVDSFWFQCFSRTATPDLLHWNKQNN